MSASAGLMRGLRDAIGVAVRRLVRRRTYAALLFTLLTLGFAAFIAILALVNATMVRPLPFQDAARLYNLSGLEPAGRQGTTEFLLSATQFRRWAEQAKSFDRIEAFTPTTPKLTGRGDPESLRGAGVSGGMIDLLGGRALIGRTIMPDDDVPGGDAVVLSHAFWRRRYGADSSIVGRRLIIDDVPRTVVGVMRPEFSLLFTDGDVWYPLSIDQSQLDNQGLRFLRGIAHLRPGATVAQAAQDLAVANAQLAAEYPQAYRDTKTNVVPIRERLFGPQRSVVLLLAGVSLLVLLIGVANALNLTYADAVAQRTMTMTRLALGATRRAIVLLRVADVGIVAVVAGVAALLLAHAALVAVQQAYPAAFAGIGDADLDATVVAAALVAVAATALAIAIPVGLGESAASISGLAGSVTRSGGDARDRRRRGMLIGAQVALTLVLASSTTVLVRNVRALLELSPGFSAGQVMVVPMTLSTQKYATPEARATYVRALLDAVRAVPGVQAASTTQTRFVLAEVMMSGFELQEHPSETGRTLTANIRHVTPDLLKTLGVRLRSGRPIDDSDRMDTPPVAMVNASFAEKYFPGESPIGQHIRRAGNGRPWMEIVGVIDDVMDAGLGYDVGPAYYVDYFQQNTPTARVTLVARVAGDAVATSAAIQRAIWSVDPTQVMEGSAPLTGLMDISAARPRFVALVSGLFGIVALVVAIVGIYVVTLHDVARRARDLAICAALGASRTELLRSAVRAALVPVAIGAVVGVGACVPALQLLHRALDRTLATGDGVSVAVAALALMAGAGASAIAAGWRVTSIDPAEAMRAS